MLYILFMKNDKEIFDLVKSSPTEEIHKPKKSTKYYLESFKKITKGIFVFNLPAFLFGTFWLIYRKMYLFAFFFFVASVFLPVPYIIVASIFGFLANYLYFKHLQEKAHDGETEVGVNKWIIPLTIIGLILMNILFSGNSHGLNPNLRAC